MRLRGKPSEYILSGVDSTLKLSPRDVRIDFRIRSNKKNKKIRYSRAPHGNGSATDRPHVGRWACSAITELDFYKKGRGVWLRRDSSCSPAGAGSVGLGSRVPLNFECTGYSQPAAGLLQQRSLSPQHRGAPSAGQLGGLQSAWP